MANPTTAALQAIIDGGGQFALAGITYGRGPGQTPVAPNQGTIDAIYQSMAAVGHYPSFAAGSIGFADANGVPASDPGLLWDNSLKVLSMLGASVLGSKGEGVRIDVNEEQLTLGTGALFTDTVGNLLPANSLILAVMGRVTTTITTSANWALGDANTATRFSAADTTLTAGESVIGINQWSGAVTTLNNGPSQAAAAKVRVTLGTSNPGAGALSIAVIYAQFTGLAS